MTADGSPRLTLTPPATEVFDRSIRRLLEKLDGPSDERSPLEARAFVEAFAEHVRGRLRGTILTSPPPELLADRLFRLSVEALTQDLIDSASEPEAAAPTLQVLRVLADLTLDGSDGAECRESELRARLRAPDAFELLVEVAHDFRSPLTSILFLAETLRDGNSGAVTDLQRSQLGLVYSAAFGLASVASDLIDLARRESDSLEDDPEPYAIREVFETVVRLVSPIVEEKGLDLKVVVPELASSYGHPRILSRVILNLTTNALKFTDEGFVEIGVRPDARARLTFYVQDTGRGIPASRQEELFQPFKRRLGDGQDGHFFSGSGVGLSIARRLVAAMGSELVLETSDERGTRFSFTLPRQA